MGGKGKSSTKGDFQACTQNGWWAPSLMERNRRRLRSEQSELKARQGVGDIEDDFKVLMWATVEHLVEVKAS